MTQPTPEPAIRAADTFLVSCIDPRLTDDTTFLQTALGRTDRYSEMRIAGAALAAVDGNRPAWGTALWENLAASRALHGIRRVTFVNHRDCGAMHLWAGRRLADDPADEARVHAEVLNRAAAEVRARHPDLLVEIKLMELDGSARLLPCPACVPAGFRAEADTALAPTQAAATLGTGMALPGPDAGADPEGFAELVRLRGPAFSHEEGLALLETGVTRYGLSAREAQEIRAATLGADPAARERDVLAFLRTVQDRHKQLDRRGLEQAGRLYRRLAGVRVTAEEAERAAARIARGAGIEPAAEGIWPFRSTAWFEARAAEAPQPARASGSR